MKQNLKTRNFSLSEVIHSDFESFPNELLPIAYIALGTIQMLRDAINAPLYITSGYRSRGYNATLPNSSVNSYHIWRWEGDKPIFALDIHCPVIPSSELIGIVAKLVFGEVYEHTTMKFVHLAPGIKDETFQL